MSFKRVLALVLALTMIFSLAMPGSWAFAEEDDGIVAVEDGYNEEGIVEDPVEEVPAITEETPAEEPAAEVIVPDDEPAEEPEETEEEEELDELLLEDLDTFEATGIGPDDVAKVGKNGYASVQAAVTFLQDNGITSDIYLLKDSTDSVLISGGVDITIRPNPTTEGETSGTEIGAVTIGAGTDKVTLSGITIVSTLTVNTGNVDLNKVTVNSNVEINGGTLNYVTGEVKGTVNVNGGSFIVNEPVGEAVPPKFGTVNASDEAVKRTVMSGTYAQLEQKLIAFGYKLDNGRVVANTESTDKVLATEDSRGILTYYATFTDLVPVPDTVYVLKDAFYEIPAKKTITIVTVGNAKFEYESEDPQYDIDVANAVTAVAEGTAKTYSSVPFFGSIVTLDHLKESDDYSYLRSFVDGATIVATNSDHLGLLVFPNAKFEEGTFKLPEDKTLTVGFFGHPVAEEQDAVRQFASVIEHVVPADGCYFTATGTKTDLEEKIVPLEVKGQSVDVTFYIYTFQNTPVVAMIGNTPYKSLSDAVDAVATPTDVIVLYRAGEYTLKTSDVLNIRKNSGDLDLTLKSPQPYLYVTPKVATTTELETYKLEMYHAKIGSNWYETLSDAAKAYTKNGDPIFVLTNCKLDTAENSKDKIELTADLPIIKINENGHEKDITVFTNATGKAIKVSGPDSNSITTYELVDAVAYINEFVPANSYPTLEDAIKAAATSTDVVYLATSTELAAGKLTIDKAITIDGDNNSITVKPNAGSEDWGFGLTLAADVTLKNVEIKRDAEDNTGNFVAVCANSGKEVTLNNVTIELPFSDGKYRWAVYSLGAKSLSISNSHLTAKYVVGMIGENTQVTMSNSTAAAGWAVIDSHATGASVEIDHCELSSLNYFSGPTNDYAMFAFTDGKNTSVEVTNSTMVIEVRGDQKQAISGGNSEYVNTVNLGEGNTVTFIGEKAIFNYGESDLNISGGTFNKVVPAEYCAEGYEPSIISYSLYGVNHKTVVAYEVYATDTTLLMSYVATQSELAIAEVTEANGSKFLKTGATIELATGTSIYVATDTNVISDETNELVKTFYPTGSTEANAQYMKVQARAYIAALLNEDGQVAKYYPQPTAWQDAVREANEASGTLKFLQTVQRAVPYTMVTELDKDGNYKSLTLTAADGVDYSNVDIKAPAYYQLHKSKEGDTYTIGAAIAAINYMQGDKATRTDYFDNIHDAATDAVNNNVGLVILASPTDANDTYYLATGTSLYVVGGIDIQDHLDSGNNALIVTPGTNNDFSYTVEATVASVNDVNYRSFKEAVAVATKTDATVVLVKKPADNDKISLTAEDKDYELTVQDKGLIATYSDLFDIPADEVYFDTAVAADGATTYTLQRYAAVLTDGTGAPTYYKAGELNNAIDEYYKNPTHYAFVELLDDGTYTMAQTAKKLPVKDNDYKFTATPTDANAFKIEVEKDTSDPSVKIYSVAVYVARVDWTKFVAKKSVVQGKTDWVSVETGKNLAKTLTEAVATASDLATKTDAPDVGDEAYEYTITLLAATGTDYVLPDGDTLVLIKNGFTPTITATTPASYVVIEDPDGTYTSYKKYTITYNLNGATNSDLNPTYYTTATPTVILHDPEEKTGHTFDGWYSEEKFTNKVVSIDTKDKEDKTLYAKFDANTFTVKFDANGGLGTMTDLLLTYATDTTLTENIFTKVGNTFKGWNTAADGTGTAYADKAAAGTISTEKDAEVTLFAQWKPNTFTVKFDNNGGNGTMSDQTFTYGTDTTLTRNTFTSGSGYTGFQGWNTKADGSGTSYADGAAGGTISETDNAEVTLYAQWGAAKFTLHFDGQGATSGTMEDMTLTYASATSLPANTFKKDGNEFQGWTLTEGGDLWASDGSALTDANVNALFAKATGTDLTVNFYAKWQPKNVQVGEKFYDKFVEAVNAAAGKNPVIVWATPSDAYGVTRGSGTFVVSVKDMRTSPADKAVNGGLLVVNDPTVYFAESDPVDGVITYTLTKYAARLTDGKGTVTYYKTFDGTDEATAAVAAYLANPGYYKYIEILDDVNYTMAYDTWAKDGLYLPVKVTYGSFATPTALDDTYSINTLTAAERTAAGIDADADAAYAVGLNTVMVQFHHVKLVNSQTQGQTEWVDDTSVPVAKYTRYYDSLEKAVAAIRAARTNLDANKQKVLVTITVSADDTLVLTAENEEYTITFENGASADVTIAQALEATCALTTTGEAPTFTYKAFVVNGTDVNFVNQTAAGAPISTYKATAGTKIINPGDPMNPIDSSIKPYEYKGYYFDKWYKDAEMTEEFDFNAETVPAEGPLTVYGRFLKATYTLTLDFAGGTAPADWTLGNAIEYSIDSNNFKLPALKNGDYTFVKWDGVAADGEKWSTKEAEYVWTPVNNPKNWKLTAVWSGAEVKVDFVDSVTQTLIASQVTQEEGAALVAPTLADVKAKIPEKNYPEGKTLVADRLWQGVDADTVASKDVTVYNLNWLDLYEVKFHANGIDFGSAEVADGDIIPADSIPNIRMTGKTAVWHIGSEDGEVFDILNDVVTDNLDLYATFADQVKVTFLADDGLYIEKLIVSGETVEQPADPEPAEGFDFVGWYLEDAEEAFDFETPITENTTLTAKFAMNADYFKGIVYTASAQLAESINLNLKMANVPAGTSAADYYVKVSVNGNETENTFEQNGDAAHLKAIAERAYAFQMNDVVDMSVYYVGLEEPIKVITGYSLRQYFENRYRAANTSNNEKAMFKAALDYGAAAQLNFNYDVENLANSTVNPENALPTVEKPNSKASREGTIDGITSYKVSLVMDSQVAVKFKVNAANKDDYTFMVDGYDFKVSDAPVNGYYEIDVTGFTPLNLKNNVTLTITKGSELVKLSYSPYTYAANKWASTENNGALANLVKAMVIFGNAVATWNDHPNG